MPIDFTLGGGGPDRPIDPYEIFKQRPAVKGSPDDLWQGQKIAIDEWHQNFDNENDVLISLNTGAGKSIIGALIAQSIVNRTNDTCVYICPTNNLVKQTYKEAKKVGLSPTIYIDREFSNENYSRSESFCITNYHAVFNSFSKFRRELKPEAVIFDDAHVSEQILRQQYTLKIFKSEHKEVYSRISSLLLEQLSYYNLRDHLRNIYSGDYDPGPLWIPPVLVVENSTQLEKIISEGVKREDFQYKNSLQNLIGKIKYCTIIINKAQIEISPPFIPSQSHSLISSNSVKRVYLSATLNSLSDFSRAFGRAPKRVIRPPVDAGNGERLVVFDKFLEGGEFTPELAHKVAKKHKVLFAVPTYGDASKWEKVVTPPDDGAFDTSLESFKAADVGTFLLVGRYDGIDLPGDDCRIMVISGVPAGSSLQERYLWEKLHMEHSFTGRIANRITQLFGRICRGRTDFGIFVLQSKGLRNWLNKPKRRALLPDLLRRQIDVGEKLLKPQQPVKAQDLIETIARVIDRDEQWLEFYKSHVLAVASDDSLIAEVDDDEKVISTAARHGVIAWSNLWHGDRKGAKDFLLKEIQNLSSSDSQLAGWHFAWAGVLNWDEGNKDAAYDYFYNARNRLSKTLPLPHGAELGGIEEPLSDRARRIFEFVSGAMPKVISRIEDTVVEINRVFDVNVSHNIAEEAVRLLGEVLGFESERPCKKYGSGPDNFYIDNENKLAIAIELKHEKTQESLISKDDMGQSIANLSWIKKKHGDVQIVGSEMLLISGTNEVSKEAPSDDAVVLSDIAKLKHVIDPYTQFLTGLKDKSASDKRKLIQSACETKFSIEEIQKLLRGWD